MTNTSNPNVNTKNVNVSFFFLFSKVCGIPPKALLNSQTRNVVCTGISVKAFL